MTHLSIPLDEMANDLVINHIKMLCQQAYEQGVSDAQKRFSLPHTLTKEHLQEIFQIKLPTVNKLVANPTFPRLKDIQARYPRDQVFKWIENNTNWVEQNTNYFKAI
jgi:hypothetical protein